MSKERAKEITKEIQDYFKGLLEERHPNIAVENPGYGHYPTWVFGNKYPTEFIQLYREYMGKNHPEITLVIPD